MADEAPSVELGERESTPFELSEPAVLGATPRGRLVYDTAACEDLRL